MTKPTRRLPAEWEKHQATLLSFPHDGKDWPGKFEAVKWAFVEIIRKVADHEPVLLLVKNVKHQAVVAEMLERAHTNFDHLQFLLKDTNRSWMRDSGPIVVQTAKGGREALQFGFNGWAKYHNYRKDVHNPAAVAAELNLPWVKVMYQNRHVVLEGGAIDINGKGTLVTTEECLLHPKIQVRNPGFTKADYEAVFAEYLGITNTIWLADGIDGDDTHGHVDDICRFVNENTVVAAVEPNKKDPNHAKLAHNIELLKNAKLQDGSPLNIVEIPMPGRIDFEDMRLPASYVNFLFTEKTVLVPTFNDANDRIALDILAKAIPNRTIIGINATDLIWGLGTLHCLSHEITA